MDLCLYIHFHPFRPAMALNKSNIVSIVFFAVSALLLLATFYNHKPFRDHFQDPKKGENPHKGRYVFVDLGANRADSLEVFLGHENSKFVFDFPRPDWATHEEAGEDCTLCLLREDL